MNYDDLYYGDYSDEEIKSLNDALDELDGKIPDSRIGEAGTACACGPETGESAPATCKCSMWAENCQVCRFEAKAKEELRVIRLAGEARLEGGISNYYEFRDHG
jgi:hypothetical protein